VGLSMALALTRQDVAVRIIDKAAVPSDKSKALVVWPRTLELLDIQGCVQPFVDAGRQATGARVISDGKLLVHVRLDTAASAYPYALMIPQSHTERLLTEQLQKCGVAIERQVTLTGFVDDGHGVSASLSHANGADESFRAAYLLGCDGAHSVVRHLSGAQFEGDTLASDWLLADVLLDGDLVRDEISICWTPHGILVLFPIMDSRFRMVADLGSGGDDDPAPTLDAVQAVLTARGPAALQAHDPIWISRFRINERKVGDYRKGRVFLAGDAAHVHSPAGGQGMNTGMQDAFNLSWKLAMVWHNRAAASLLDSYSPERSAIGDLVVRNAGNMTKIAILRNPILQELRSLAIGALGQIGALRQRFVDQLTELDLDYRETGLTTSPHGSSRHPAGGDRAPDVPLTVGDEAVCLHQLLARGKFAVVSVGAAEIALPPSLRAIAAAAHAATATGYAPDHVYLIRPDAYVMMSTAADDPTPIIIALERIRMG
jgi:2-polyprenyl-6-methoxyphenol hydroxylase-like FAD-dependent oxidoreductase